MSDNVVNFPGFTMNLNEFNENPVLTAENIADGIVANEVVEVFVVGIDADGEFYMAGNIPGKAKIVYLLERAKIDLMTKEMVLNV